MPCETAVFNRGMYYPMQLLQRAGIQAYTALHYQMRATKGDVILITRGAHGARTAFLNLAHHWGFRVLVTVLYLGEALCEKYT